MRSLGLIVASLVAAGIVILYSLPMEGGGTQSDMVSSSTLSSSGVFSRDALAPLSLVYTCDGGFASETGSVTVLSGSLFVMQQDPLDRREIAFGPLRISPRTNGTLFFSQSSPSVFRLYSFDALADVSIVEGTGAITSFPLFPGIRFVHDTAQHAQLKGADFIRLATLDDIAYVSSVSQGFTDAIIPGAESEKKECFEAARADVGEYIKKSARLELGEFTLPPEDGQKPLNPLIHNRAKLLAEYRRELIDVLRPLVRSREAGSAQSVEIILARLTDDPLGQKELLPFVEKTARAAWAQGRLDEKFSRVPLTQSTLLWSPWKSVETDEALSHVFTRVSFLEGRPTEVRDVIFAFLKSSPKEDLSRSLARTYIATEYVLKEAITADTRALEAISLLIGAGDIPYNSLKSTAERSRLATLLFTDHARVTEELILRLKTKLFTSVNPVKFRDAYLAGSTLVPEGMEEALGRTINTLKKDTEEKKSVYYTSRQSDGTRDAYVRLTESIALLQGMYDAMGALRERRILDPVTASASINTWAVQAPPASILTSAEIAQLSPVMKGIENYLRPETVAGTSVIRLVKYPLTIRSGSSVYKLLVSGIFRPQRRDWFRLEASATFESKQINLIEMPKPLSMDGLVAFAPKLATLLDTAFLRSVRPDQKVSFQIDSVTIDGTSYRTAQ